MKLQDLITLIIHFDGKIVNIKSIISDYMKPYDSIYPSHWPLFQKAYHHLFLNESIDQVLCPGCQKPLKFLGIRKGYPKNCSYSCRSKNPNTHQKYKKTCQERYGVDFVSQSKIFRQQVINTNIIKYGVDNPMKNANIRQEHQKSCIIKYGVDNPSKNNQVLQKIRKTKIKHGFIVADEVRSALDLYRLQVKQITKRSYHDNYYKINPDNLPRGRFYYHVDHVFSIEEGFKNSVPPEIIGHWTNLRMLWHLENCRKNTKCHITIEELMSKYHNSI